VFVSLPVVDLQLCLQELLASVAPKKANWDLKREVEPRLAKLERRTQRALVEMLLQEEQQRLQQEGGVAD
jgi:coiled-coil domain-containing protein 12